jgi:hypothetical protein
MTGCRLLVVSLATLVILASVNLVSAKGLDLAVGWHRLAERIAERSGPEPGGRLPGGQPLYSLGIFFNDFGDRHRTRIGFRYTTHQTLHERDGIGRSFRVQCFLFDYQRQVLWHKPWRVVLDAGVGLSTFSTHVPYPYDASTELSIHVRAPATVAPGLSWQCQIARQFTLQAGLWYYWILEDPDDLAPFRSGPTVMLGLGYTLGAETDGDTKGTRHGRE